MRIYLKDIRRRGKRGSQGSFSRLSRLRIHLSFYQAQGSQPDVEVGQRILQVHALVLFRNVDQVCEPLPKV